MSAVILQFPADAIYREVPTLTRARSLAERCELIDALSPADHANLEAQLADDLFAAIFARNRHSLRPDMHPKAACPDFGEPGEPVDEAQHLFALRQARRQLDWLIGRLEGKQARAAAKKREG